LPGTTWLYFALSQFPIYLAPQLLQPLLRRLLAPPAVTAATSADA
jgi:BASS family bile acid:Na+ symporter